MTSNTATILTDEHRDPFYYGYRPVERRMPDGTTRLEQQPLGPDALIDPQMGDVVIQGVVHFACVADLYQRLRLRWRDRPDMAVFADLKMLWRIPGLKEPAPDIAVIPGVHDRDASRDSFDITAEGTRPCLVVEVMSRRYTGDDTAKPSIYARAGIPEYLIIKPYGKRGERLFKLWGHRLVGSRYCPWPADADGWLHSTTTGVGFRATPDNRDLEVIDSATGEPLPRPEEIEDARREAVAAAAALREQAEAQVARAQIEAERAAIEAERATAAEHELARLRALLRAKGIDPDA